MRGFRRGGDGVGAKFGVGEAALVRTLAEDVRELLLSRETDDGPDPAAPAADSGDAPDPLVALTGMTGPPVGLPGDPDAVPPRLPEDPALARLLPDAYTPPAGGGQGPGSGQGQGPDLAEAAGDFRRYTEDELRRGKVAALETLLATLPGRGGRVLLDDAQASQWLTALNDIRLTLGARLEVTEEMLAERPDPADPQAPAREVFDFLGWLQDTLVQAVAGW